MAKIGNDRDLAFWLQGYFEISGSNDLSADTLREISLKINQMPEQGEMAKFILATVLESGFEGQGPTIAAKLNDTFEHVIDPTIEGDHQELKNIHRPKGGGVVAMC